MPDGARCRRFFFRDSVSKPRVDTMTGVFDPLFDDLPQEIPVFPLTGVLLLPQGKLPLNIFEPRYLNMINAALRGAPTRATSQIFIVPAAPGGSRPSANPMTAVI